jgi:hypothetical protein
MAAIERGELLDCLMPFALYYQNTLKPTLPANAPGNTPVLGGAFTLGDFLDPWMVMQNDDQAKQVFGAITAEQKANTND